MRQNTLQITRYTDTSKSAHSGCSGSICPFILNSDVWVHQWRTAALPQKKSNLFQFYPLIREQEGPITLKCVLYDLTIVDIQNILKMTYAHIKHGYGFQY